MDQVIFTPRLKLTLLTQAERGSQELEWCHRLHSNEQSTWWSIIGRSKTIEDTEKRVARYLTTSSPSENTYRVAYAVHEILEEEPTSDNPKANSAQPPPAQQDQNPTTQFIGSVIVGSIPPGGLALPQDLTLPASTSSITLTIELAYMFLPSGWGKGYATESITALLSACKRAPSFWSPYSKVYVRVIVNKENAASLRVMQKIPGITRRGPYTWTGEAIFHCGEWRTKDYLEIFGVWVLE